MKSINTKLTLIMSCVVLIAIVITVGIGATISGNAIVNEAKEKLRYEADRQALVLDEWIANHTATVNTTAVILSQMDDYSKANLSGIFGTVLNQQSVYQDVYMGFENNTAIMGSGFPIENEYSWWRATERDWYRLAMADPSRVAVSSLYVDTATNDLCITVAKAVSHGNAIVGVVGIDMLVNVLQDMVFSLKFNDNSYSMLLDAGGNIMIHPDKDYAPDALGNFQNLAGVKNGAYSGLWRMLSTGDAVYEYKNAGGTSNYYTESTLGTTGWRLVTVLPTSVITQTVNNIIVIIVPVTVLILILSALLIFMTVKSNISVPIAPCAAFFNKSGTTGDISLGQDDIAIISRYSNRPDEIGQMIRSAAAFVKRITEVSEALEMVSGGDLTSEFQPLSANDKLGLSVQKMTESMNDVFAEISSSTIQFSNGSRQIADRSQALAQGATEQAASVEQLSSSISEIADKTKKNANMAEKAAVLSGTIKDNAVKGSKQMNEMMDAVNQINESSGSIGKVIKVIDDIAFQTNILALNAAVEAARAGQHGKGFAVVAEEVRNLAAKSAEAAKDTGVLIENSIEKANLGVRIAGETADSLTEIVTGINESSQLVSEIAKSSEEQSLGIEQINIGIDQVAQVVQHNSASAEEEAASSEEMSSQATILHELLSQFKLKGGDRQMRLTSGRSQKVSDIPDRIELTPALSGGAYGKY